MRRWLLLPLLAMMIVMGGCNLGATPPTEEPLPTEDTADTDSPADDNLPQIEILSPDDGDTFTVDEEILVSVRATDSIGVTRVQLLANGTIVKTISSETLSGDTTLQAILDFTPRLTGDFVLRVIAYRGATASQPAQITVNVVAEASGGNPGGGTGGTGGTGSSGGTGSTGGTGSSIPVIPNDGVCRALTATGLNLRTLPTTEQDNIITVLPVNTLVPIVGRLGDNSWWQVAFGGNIGWISAQFVTLSGNCLYVPVINPFPPPPPPTWTPPPLPTWTPIPTLTPVPVPSDTPIPPAPDLVVPGISVQGADDLIVELPPGDTDVEVTIGVTITNVALGTAGSFRSVMQVDGVGDFDLGVVGSLEPGVSILLTQDVTLPGVGTYDVRVDVDVDEQVVEISEINNRGDITIEVVAP